jgi:hypothetical protein
MSDVGLAMLLVRRLAHDFAGPVGAIGTAVEMLDDGADAELVALVADSARELGALLRLLRFIMAPGAASGDEGRDLLTAWLLARDAPAVAWPDSDDWPAGTAALTTGLAMLASEAARGGVLSVGPREITLAATAINFADDVAATLEGRMPAETTAQAVAGVLAGQAATLGRRLNIERGDGVLTIRG